MAVAGSFPASDLKRIPVRIVYAGPHADTHTISWTTQPDGVDLDVEDFIVLERFSPTLARPNRLLIKGWLDLSRYKGPYPIEVAVGVVGGVPYHTLLHDRESGSER